MGNYFCASPKVTAKIPGTKYDDFPLELGRPDAKTRTAEVSSKPSPGASERSTGTSRPEKPGSSGGSGKSGKGGNAGGGDSHGDDKGKGKEKEKENKTLFEVTVTEVRRTYPNVSTDEANAIATNILLGLPMAVAYALGIFQTRTVRGEERVTTKRMVTRLQQQLENGQTPRLSQEDADELAEAAKRNPALRDLLRKLPRTDKVNEVRDTTECSDSFTLNKALCGAPDPTKLTAAAQKFLNKRQCGDFANKFGLVALACCKCANPGKGCQDTLALKRSYACTAKGDER